MSFVVAVVKANEIIIAGDTQLNHREKGPLQITGMKVFPIGNNTLVGMTGDYDSYLESVNNIGTIDNISTMNLNDKVDYIKKYTQQSNRKNNIVIASLENNIGKVVVMGDNYGFNNPIERVINGANIKVLMPPNVTEEMCRPYIYSLTNLKQQVINCIKGISKISDEVNDKIIGFELNNNGFKLFTDNIKYEDINYKILFN